MCRTFVVFDFAPNIDDELDRTEVKCPYISAWRGVACKWTGRWSDMTGHVHCFVEPPRTAEVDAADAAADDSAQTVPPAAAAEVDPAAAEVDPRPADQPAGATADDPQPQSPGGLWNYLWNIFG